MTSVLTSIEQLTWPKKRLRNETYIDSFLPCASRHSILRYEGEILTSLPRKLNFQLVHLGTVML